MSDHANQPLPLAGDGTLSNCRLAILPEDLETKTPPVPLSHYTGAVRRHLWKVAAFVVICAASAFVLLSRLEPVYEATAVIDIDRQAPSEVIGQGATRAGAPNDAEQFIGTQVDLVQSDAVLRPVAIHFNLLEREGRFRGRTPEEIRSIRRSAIVLKRLKVTHPPKKYLLLISYRAT